MIPPPPEGRAESPVAGRRIAVGAPPTPVKLRHAGRSSQRSCRDSDRGSDRASHRDDGGREARCVESSSGGRVSRRRFALVLVTLLLALGATPALRRIPTGGDDLGGP